MAVEDTTVYQNILDLVNRSEPPAYYKWTCSFIIDGDSIDAVSVDGLTITRDYQECFSDITLLEVSVPAGTYTYTIYPNKDNMIVQLIQERVKSTGESIVDSESLKTIRSRATLIGSGSPAVVDYDEAGEDLETMNHADTIPLIMQLTDIVVESIKQTQCNTIFHDTSVSSLLTVMLKNDSYVGGPNTIVNGVELFPPTNERIYDHVIVPPGTLLADLPDLIQNNYGIYTSGLGSYVQNNIWYLFPLLRTNTFLDNKHKVTILSVPENKYYGSEKTYSLEEDQLYILATGQTEHSDDTDSLPRNIGNGVIYQNAGRVIDEYSVTRDGTTTIDRTQNIIKYVGYERDDDSAFTPYYRNISTSNHCTPSEQSVLAHTATMVINWHNSDPDLLYPGMAIRFMYREGERVLSLYGTVVTARYNSNASIPGVLQDVHSNTTTIGIVLNK